MWLVLQIINAQMVTKEIQTKTDLRVMQISASSIKENAYKAHITYPGNALLNYEGGEHQYG